MSERGHVSVVFTCEHVGKYVCEWMNVGGPHASVHACVCVSVGGVSG